MTANPVVRAALMDRLTAHQAGVLSGVTVLDAPPLSYDQVHQNSRGSVRLVWLGESSAVIEDFAQCGPGQMSLIEVGDLTVIVQADEADGSTAVVDQAAGQIMSAVWAILSTQDLGADYVAEGLDSLRIWPASWSYASAPLATGGSDSGHAAAYAITVAFEATIRTTEPVIP